MNVIIVGTGEVGREITELCEESYQYTVATIEEPTNDFSDFKDFNCDIMHICFGYDKNFIKEVRKYIVSLKPKTVIINSTVPVGTTRLLENSTKIPVISSPVIGNINDGMKNSLLKYTKCFGGTNNLAIGEAMRHFNILGIKSEYYGEPEVTELGKLGETTYYALMIAFHHEIYRICKKLNISFKSVTDFWGRITNESEGKHLRPVFYPGKLGGHCLMPNIKLLKRTYQSKLWDFIEESNEKITTFK